MPTYKVSGTVFVDQNKYLDGELVTLPDGALRDELLEAGAIYRHDLLPYCRRQLPDGRVWVPATRVNTPGRNYPAVPSLNPESGPAYQVPGYGLPSRLVWYGFYLTPLDEWILSSWPWSGPWMVINDPGRKLRPMP